MPNAPVPDFFIIGAMKSGTTTIHKLLSLHPDIFLPNRELFRYDLDDWYEHPNFIGHPGMSKPIYRSGHPEPRHEFDYSRFYPEADCENRLIGEDSTTYLASRLAPERLWQANPKAKIICALREPVARAWSNYWHLVQHGQATKSFERTLKRYPYELLERGCYASQIANYLEYFPREQIRFVLFEDLVEDPEACVNELVEWLGLPVLPLELGSASHANKTLYPARPWLKYLFNHLLFEHHGNKIPNYLAGHKPRPSALTRFLLKLERNICGMKSASALGMSPGIRGLLVDFYDKRNAGLGELIGSDLKFWKNQRIEDR